MSTHRWATATLLVLLASLLSLDLFRAVPWWGYLLPLACFFAGAVIGSSRIDSGYHLPALCHGARSEKTFSLSFDDGPDPEVTPKVLDLLREKGIRASFFVIGERADAHPELVERIHREGHFLGNHSWSHGALFDLFPTGKVMEELRRTSERLAGITGRYPLAFRPPYGVTNPMLRRAVDRLEMLVVGWDLRSFDTKLGEEKSAQRVLRRMRPGSLVLLHDTDRKVVRILSRILEGASKDGYRPVSLEELLQRNLSYETDASMA